MARQGTGLLRPAGRAAALTTWLAVAGFLAWSLSYFATALGDPPRRTMSLAGLGLTSAVLLGWSVVSVRLRSARRPVAADGEFAAASSSSRLEELPQSVEGLHVGSAAEAAMWADEAMATLEARVDGAANSVTLVRVGGQGVEILLEEPLTVAPPDFSLLGDGRTLRFPIIEPPRAGAGGSGSRHVQLGVNADGYYFVPAGSVTLAEAPHEPARIGGTMFLVEDGPGHVLEPFGLRLTPSSGPEPEGEEALAEAPESPGLEDLGSDGRSTPDLSAAEEPAEAEMAPRGVSSAPPSEPTPTLGTDLDNPAGQRPDEPTAGPTGLVQLEEPAVVAPGPVEVRILRDEPALVGALLEDPNAPAVEFVAYLALHGHRATTARLRDALGTARSRASRSGRTVWNAAAFARRSLGEDLIPQASGNQLYELSPTVTSDWGRFCQLVAMARSTPDEALSRRCLVEALELVEGVPASSSQRFGWLDEERLLAEIADEVLRAVGHLAELELAAIGRGDGSRDLVVFAIKKGRILQPRALELAELETRLGKLEADLDRTPSVEGLER